jgi:hypothetical protein
MHNRTAERPADDLESAHARLMGAVGQLVTSDDWRRMLDVASRFHDYSPSNCILIMTQRPTATRVAGYRAWQAMGRQVLKGERAIRIIAPIVKRLANNEAAEDQPTSRVVAWRLAAVFDVTQTEGEPLPEVAPKLLSGAAPEALWVTLAARIDAAGFTLQRGDCGPANGWTDHRNKIVRVRDDVSSAQGAKTLAHELAHVLLHSDRAAYPRCRDVAEVEAESVAYLVCHAAGLPSDAYTFPYVARWAKGDLARVQGAATRAISTARAIVSAATGEEDIQCESLAISA